MKNQGVAYLQGERCITVCALCASSAQRSAPSALRAHHFASTLPSVDLVKQTVLCRVQAEAIVGER